MSDPIKSADLCARCVYDYYRHCMCKMLGNCADCVMDATGKPGGCKCLAIKPNTPCQYFEEVKDNAAD